MAYSNDTGLPSVTTILRPYLSTDYYTSEARDRGTAVHAACAAHLRGLYVVPLLPACAGYFDSFRRWCDAVKPAPSVVERRFADHNLGYCGQPDFIDGEECATLYDIKTAAAKANWWPLQLAGYRKLVQSKNIKISNCATLRLKSNGKIAVCDFISGSNAYENLFMSALNLYRYFNA